MNLFASFGRNGSTVTSPTKDKKVKNSGVESILVAKTEEIVVPKTNDSQEEVIGPVISENMTKKKPTNENMNTSYESCIGAMLKAREERGEQTTLKPEQHGFKPSEESLVVLQFELDDELTNLLDSINTKSMIGEMIASVDADMGTEQVETKLMAKLTEAQQVAVIGLSSSQFLKQQYIRSDNWCRILGYPDHKARATLGFLIALHYIKIVSEKKALTVTATNKSLIFHISLVVAMEFVVRRPIYSVFYESMFKMNQHFVLFECRNLFIEALDEKKAVTKFEVKKLAKVL